MIRANGIATWPTWLFAGRAVIVTAPAYALSRAAVRAWYLLTRSKSRQLWIAVVDLTLGAIDLPTRRSVRGGVNI